MTRTRYLVIAIVVPVVSLVIAFGVARKIVTCGERFPTVSGRLPSGVPADGVLSEYPGQEASGQQGRTGVLADAANLSPGSGAGRVAWALPLVRGVTGIEPASTKIIISDGGEIGGYDASDGKLDWERDLPGQRSALVSTTDGVAVVSAPLNDGDGRTDVAFMDSDGNVKGCQKLSDKRGEVEKVAGGPGETIGTLVTKDGKTKVTLYDNSGDKKLWEKEVDGTFESIDIAGGHVVLGDAGGALADGPPKDAAVGLSSDDGSEDWKLPIGALAPAGPSPSSLQGLASLSHPYARLTHLRGDGPLMIGLSAIRYSDAGETVGGKLVALDARSGKVFWVSDHDLPDLRAADPLTPANDLILAAPGDPGNHVEAFDARTGRRLWSTPTSPGSDQGALLRVGPKIYSTGGRPLVLDAASGHATPLTRSKTATWFGLDGGLGQRRLAVMFDSGPLLVWRLDAGG
jgi:outer membrane protein assembly factor BamB